MGNFVPELKVATLKKAKQNEKRIGQKLRHNNTILITKTLDCYYFVNLIIITFAAREGQVLGEAMIDVQKNIINLQFVSLLEYSQSGMVSTRQSCKHSSLICLTPHPVEVFYASTVSAFDTPLI